MKGTDGSRMGADPHWEQVRIIKELKKFDTATICNVVATYPGSELCLNLYDAWRGEYYTDTTVRCIYPELAPVCGFAATVWYSNWRAEHTQMDRWDLPNHLDGTPKPIVLVAKQTYSEGLENLSGLFGGNMTTQFKALGVEGILTDGPMRDYVEIKEMNVQYVARGLTSGHGPIQVRSTGIPLKVAGMTVVPGDIIHMDQCGACKFPAEKLPEVLEFATELISREKKEQAKFRDPGFSLEKWKLDSK
jgi:4-hydroxy-4-methyl-2-oxoglutarate aldolase